MIVLDSSGLFAALDEAEPEHQACVRTLRDVSPPFVLSPFVLAEVDYLLLDRIGQGEELAFLREVSLGAYRLEPFTDRDVDAAVAVIERYADLRLGLADASVVVLARRYGTDDVLTLDQRHFRPIEVGPGRSFRLRPLDL